MYRLNAIVGSVTRRRNLSERARKKRRRPRRNESGRRPKSCNSAKENLKKRKTRAIRSINESHPWRDGSGNMSQKERLVETIMTMKTTIIKMTIIGERKIETEMIRRKEGENNSETTWFYLPKM